MMNEFENNHENRFIEELDKRYEVVLVENSKEKSNGKNKNRKKHKFARNIAVFSLVGVLSFGSLGYGIGLGIGHTQKNNVSSVESNSDASFVNTATLTSSSSNDGSYSDVIKSVENSIVSINVSATSVDYFGRTSQYESAGSGIIFSEDDEYIYIATNNHVIEGANSVYISVNDDAQAPANYIGSDSVSDLAVISVAKSDLTEAGIEYSIATFGSSKDLEIGDTAIAIGNALGMGKSATQGIISALNKDLEINDSHLTVLQTDAAINPGNSGGALINSKGEVIGINTAKITSTDAEGIGYSIPVDIAKPILTTLLEQGKEEIANGNSSSDSSRPYMGIEGFTITNDVKSAYNLPSTGVYITNIMSGLGAENAGLMAGDIIVEVNSQRISSMEDLSAILDVLQINDTISVSVIRNNQIGTVNVTLSSLDSLNTGF